MVGSVEGECVSSNGSLLSELCETLKDTRFRVLSIFILFIFVCVWDAHFKQLQMTDVSNT